nr:MAG TPA: hypothetical protein [Microviridae sp.]
MWFGTEEDSPTNKAKSLRRSPSFYKRCASTVHRSHPARAKKKRVRACTRARAKKNACAGAYACVFT